MSGKLSEKFANLGASSKPKPKPAVVRTNKPAANTVSERIREARLNNRTASQKNQRQQQTQQRRTGIVAASNNNNNNKPRANGNGPRNVKGKGVIVRGTLRLL